jgi:hypothetical protein
MKQILLLLFLPALLVAQKKEKEFTKVLPKVSVQAGFGIPEFYNLGYELQANYFPYSTKWVRLGPALQFNNFYIVNKEWNKNNNIEKSVSAEVRGNVLFNIEVMPAKKSSFYIGFAPYIGYQWLTNRGTLINEAANMDLSWKYNIHTFDYGTRYSLGGYFGKQQRYGMQGVLQMSNRGIGDSNPLTKFFNIGLPTYKAYVGLNFVYRIM